MSNKYRAYPECKDSDVEWLGEIPLHWNVIKLKYVAKLAGEKVLETNAKYVGMENIISGNGKYLPKDDVKPEGLSASFTKGDVLFGKLRPYLAKSWLADFSGICSSEFLVLRSELVHPKFLNYFTLTDEFIEQVNSSTYGSKMPRASWDFISLLEVPVSSFSHTKKIANFLDYETAKIDALIDKQQQLIKLLKEKRQAVISHAVTKGLNPKAPMKDSGVEWLGKVPEHWDVLRLKHLISSLESGCSVNAADLPAEPHEIGVLKTSCVYTRRFRIEENKTVIEEDLPRVKCIARKGAIIISRMNTPELVGASALVDIDVDNIYLPDRLWQTFFNPQFETSSEYLTHFMTVEGFRNQISLGAEGASSSMQNIAKEDYLAIHSLLPPFDEQLKIVEVVEKMRCKFLHLEQQATSAVLLLQERRTALISAAVTGKIDVRNCQLPSELQ